MEFNRNEVISILNRIGYQYVESGSTVKGLCPNPSHNDQSIGSFVIWPEIGACKCYSCGYSGDMIKLIRTYARVGFKEAFRIADKESDNPVIDFKDRRKGLSRSRHKNKGKFPTLPTPLKDFDHVQYPYLIERGVTKEWLREFNAKYCHVGFYECYNYHSDEWTKINLYDYMVIPFGNYWEARDVVRGSRSSNSQKRKERAKVLYPKYTDVNTTIFNEENLNRNEPLYLTEGIMSLPKIWKSVSKNCSCIFGAQISESQFDLLKQFNELIWIPDNDEAGIELIDMVRQLPLKSFVLDVKSEDKDEEYIDEILSAEKMESARFLYRRVVAGV